MAEHVETSFFAQHGALDQQHGKASRLEALDSTAVSLAMDNDMPIVVFDMTQPGNILRAVRGETIGTRIGGEERS